MRRSIALTTAVLAAAAPGAARAQSQDGFSARAPLGTFRDLAEGRLKMRVHCPTACTVAARLIVAAQDARRMALPFWKTIQLIGSESDEDTFEAGDAMLGLELATPPVRRYLVPSLAFPIFGSVRIKVELQADLDDGRSATPSVTGRLRWPGVASENGGRGTHGMVRSISGPQTVRLGTATGGWTVNLRRTAPGRRIVAGVHTAGGLLSTDDFGFYDGGRKVGPNALRRGGTFTLRVPLRRGNRRAAEDIAPLPAEVFVDVLGEDGDVRDHAIRRFTLT